MKSLSLIFSLFISNVCLAGFTVAALAVDYSRQPQRVSPASTTYPLEIEKGLVGDSRLWVRVNGWILNVEEYGSGLLLASFADYCKKPIQVEGRAATLLVETRYRSEDGKPFYLADVLMPDGSRTRIGRQFDHPGPALDKLVPPPMPTAYPLQVQTRRDGVKVAIVNGQPVKVEDQIRDAQGNIYLYFRLLYSLQPREYTVDGGSNKRRVFFSQKDGIAYEVITKYNGQVLRVTPLLDHKRIDQVMPFAYFKPGYSLTENARGYRGGIGFAGLDDPNAQPENRPPCPF
ncbi:MAG: hypothetical protein NZ772_05775 [Cyanobacteria bacterium]|nr:hypothetical protein [Cyanobacteriota bacterium]MDW8201022.1 hypothetical protein [Cyanobacteriota bacterium SKYGB_h_bin112]